MKLKWYIFKYADDLTDFINKKSIVRNQIQNIVVDGHQYTLFWWE